MAPLLVTHFRIALIVMPMGQMIKPFLPNPLTFLRICLDCPNRNIQRMSRQINPYPHFISIESRQSRRSRQIIGQATISGCRDLPVAETNYAPYSRLDKSHSATSRPSRQTPATHHGRGKSEQVNRLDIPGQNPTSSNKCVQTTSAKRTELGIQTHSHQGHPFKSHH